MREIAEASSTGSPLRASIRAAALAILCVALLGAFTASAQAAPVHPFLEELSLNGSNTPAGELDKACGVAVDSKGDRYVASANDSAIYVFDPTGAYLTTIANANKPCALAVSTTGLLYASETTTGNVVRYTPNAYPFAGTPTYGAASTIDSSALAKGIAVDPADGRLYVAEGTRVAVYKADGTPGKENEVQRLSISATGGTYKLSFKGQETGPIAFDASAEEVQTALASLATIGAGNVSVASESLQWVATFTGVLANTDVESLLPNSSGLTGGLGKVTISETTKGFNGFVGEGNLTQATGVAAYTYSAQRYVSVADAASDQVKVFAGAALGLRTTIDGSTTPDGGFGFPASGAYLAADSKTGHLYVYDAEHAAVDEFEATGPYLSQTENPAFADAGPTALAVERSGTANDGNLYVSVGAGPGAKALAFGPLPAPSRNPLAAFTFEVKNARSGAVDSAGDIYVVGSTGVSIFSPTGTLLTTIADENQPREVEVDAAGNVYVLERKSGAQKAVRFTPNSYPPSAATNYSGPVTIVAGNQDGFKSGELVGFGLNPTNGHLFVSAFTGEVNEYDSAANGSVLLKAGFGAGVLAGTAGDVAPYGANGNVYVLRGSGPTTRIDLLNAAGTEVLATLDGSKGPAGKLLRNPIAVDQSNGHVLLSEMGEGRVDEYEGSGAYVGSFGSFTKLALPVIGSVAIDSSGGPNDGNVYVPYQETLSGFGPFSYGEPPQAVTGSVSGVGGGNATLKGSVDPRGFALLECRFDYVTQAGFEANGFVGGQSAPCAESLASIGQGSGAVAVHADVSGLQADGRYRFRLAAKNKFAPSLGEPGLFGPPLLSAKAPQPVSFTEATLRAGVDPFGLPTTYRFQYGTGAGEYQHTTTDTAAAVGAEVQAQVPIFGLAPATTYHFRVVAENDAGIVLGSDQTFATLATSGGEDSCPNASLRAGLSGALPDCRAYELVSPADTRGGAPYAQGDGFDNWLTSSDGDSLVFFIQATLLGTDGNGRRDAHEMTRTPAGWEDLLFSPSAAQAEISGQGGVSRDHGFSFWGTLGEGSLPLGGGQTQYLRTPKGFELLGQGEAGSDPDAHGRFISPGGDHAIFTSRVSLAPNSPATGTEAVYDRAPGANATVVSLLPGEVTPGGNATYQGASEDGTAVVFKVGGSTYVRIDGTQTLEIPGFDAFAGVSTDGDRVFFTGAGAIHYFDTTSGTATEIAPGSSFVNVSEDGSHVYFTSKAQLDGAAEGTPGADNLYVWDGASIGFVAVLAAKDFSELKGFAGSNLIGLDRWAADNVVGPNADGIVGRANDPSRTTPDGRVLVFQSHANLTAYDAAGHFEIYRFDSADSSLLCVSCEPSGAPPLAEGDWLQAPTGPGVPTGATTHIPNVTEDGQAVFFESDDALIPADANSSRDVYEWKAQGAGSCTSPGGCLHLISSGHSANDSYLFSMTPSGSDVFISTYEKLLGADVLGSSSIYDARVNGGFAEATAAQPCQGDACQGQSAGTPTLGSPASANFTGPGNAKPTPTASRCGKGKRKVRANGKARCVKKKVQHKKSAKQSGRAGR